MICKHEIRIILLAAAILTGFAVQNVERTQVADCMMCPTAAVL
ncbi:hypothetical protein SAMN05444004_10157 [Jannaschia faecimaris]|uniref:Uncharacterized protein n=1 Tax=Jannaschia faecimaris TaxID=1244108 RepID=A0A1H3IMP1_9RHOB|nr:hypothetical protein [Jannaschia faecimaris]SDY29103.1 hypothetical protein SAMN05444004_10157 [Jannaschia faecimaris]